MNKIKGKVLKVVVKKDEKIADTVPVAKRAFGIRLPHGNPTIIAKHDVSLAKMPTNLRPVYEHIAKHKSGITLKDLKQVKSLGAPRHIQWKCRILLKREEVRVVAEAKEEVSKKQLKKAA